VNWPGRVGDEVVDVLVGIPLGEESQTQSEGTRARDGLGTGDSVFKALLAFLAEAKFNALFNI
jgi:hypothetical protein